MPDDEQSDTKRVVLRYVEEVQNGHDIEAIDSIFSEDFQDRSAVGDGMFGSGRQALKDGYRQFLNAFPDLSARIEHLVCEGDKVVAMKTLSGTHQGEHLGIPGSGRSVSFSVVSIYRVEAGLIREYWGIADEADLLKQIGERA